MPPELKDLNLEAVTSNMVAELGIFFNSNSGFLELASYNQYFLTSVKTFFIFTRKT